MVYFDFCDSILRNNKPLVKIFQAFITDKIEKGNVFMVDRTTINTSFLAYVNIFQ